MARDRTRTAAATLASPIGVAVAIFVALRVLAGLHGPKAFPDTSGYDRLDFLGGQPRLWTVPLVWTIFPTGHLRVAVQIVAGVVAWGSLAVVISRVVLNAWVRWAAVSVVLLLGLVPQVTNWDSTLLSESLSTSLLVALVALLLMLSGDRRLPVVVACFAVLVLWVFTRQSNAMLYIVLLPFVLVFTALKVDGRLRLVLLAGLLSVGVWSGVATHQSLPPTSPISELNAVEIVGVRIAPDPSALQYFASRGLPQPPALMSGQDDFEKPSPLFSDARFMGWIDHDFRATYSSYLLRHPFKSVIDPLRDGLSLASSQLAYGKTFEVLPSSLAGVLWGDSEKGDLSLWLGLALGVMLAAGLRGGRIRSLPVIVLLLISAAIGSIVIWNSSAAELQRLFMPVAVMLRLGIVLALAFSADALIREQRPRPAGPRS